MNSNSAYTNTCLARDRHISLCETLDRVLNKGVVVSGELIISVADVDLIYVGLRLVATSVETAKSACALAPRADVALQETNSDC